MAHYFSSNFKRLLYDIRDMFAAAVVGGGGVSAVVFGSNNLLLLLLFKILINILLLRCPLHIFHPFC